MRKLTKNYLMVPFKTKYVANWFYRKYVKQLENHPYFDDIIQDLSIDLNSYVGIWCTGRFKGIGFALKKLSTIRKKYNKMWNPDFDKDDTNNTSLENFTVEDIPSKQIDMDFYISLKDLKHDVRQSIDNLVELWNTHKYRDTQLTTDIKKRVIELFLEDMERSPQVVQNMLKSYYRESITVTKLRDCKKLLQNYLKHLGEYYAIL